MYEFAVAPAVTQIRRRGVVITEVTPESLAAELELEAGDRILRINGRAVRDYLDFRFQTGGETELIMEVRKQSGEDWELDIERDEGEDFGLGFEQIVPRQCANECLFCFCKGNPEDARPSLFIRDEDIRLSFLYGNYTTLTSITEDEMNRVIEQRFTPEFCRRTIKELDPVQKDFQSSIGTNFAFLGDEIYLKAGVKVPSRKHYGDYPQIEDGIGMVTSFQREFDSLTRKLRSRVSRQ